MIYLRMAMSALGAAGLLTKLVVVAGLLAALLAAYGVWHHKVYSKGYAAGVAAIAAGDARAVGRATELRGSFKQCLARDGSWDQTTGRCR